jgi:threonine dehydrogenase-like Zn-dependent dehydrogenase
MRISVIESPRNIVIKDAALPEIGAHDVLVKLEGTGVCASNLPVWEGREWFRYPFEPGSPGHEGYGTIEEVGSDSGEFKRGDKVAFLSYHAYAEYDKAPYTDVVKLPPALQKRPFPGEPVACAVNVFNRSDIIPGQTVLVIGAGFLGCLIVELLKNEGARVIVASGRETSLEYARQAGADHLVRTGDFLTAVSNIRDLCPDGLPRIIEATGAQSSLDLATELIAIRGKLVIAGYHQDGPRSINMQQWNWRGIDVINAHERDPRAYITGLQKAVDLAEKDFIHPDKYITHYVDFGNINEAFNLLKTRPEKFMKAVITY